MQRCLSSKSLQTINTQSLPTEAGRVHPSCNCSSTASTLFWSSIDFIIINYGCDLTLLNNNDNEARILSTQWSNQFELISCVRNVATYNNFFSGSNQSRFFSWELLTIRDVQFRTSYLCSYQCSPQVPTRLSWRLPKQTPSSLCHASPSCSMAICGREKNHWSQCIKGHIFFPPSVQRHAKRYGEEGFRFISLMKKITWRYFGEDWSPPIAKAPVKIIAAVNWQQHPQCTLERQLRANNRDEYSSLYSFRVR